jgi:hypothetical protein
MAAPRDAFAYASDVAFRPVETDLYKLHEEALFLRLRMVASTALLAKVVSTAKLSRRLKDSRVQSITSLAAPIAEREGYNVAP